MTHSFCTVHPDANRVVPGKLTDDEAKALYAWCYKRKVLQVGAYCGKGLIVVATVAEKVWLVENFSAYPNGHTAIAGECKASVEQAGVGAKVTLLFYGDPTVALSPDGLKGKPPYGLRGQSPDFDTVYIDPDWHNQEAAQDWALKNLPKGGRLIYHANGDIRQMTV